MSTNNISSTNDQAHHLSRRIYADPFVLDEVSIIVDKRGVRHHFSSREEAKNDNTNNHEHDHYQHENFLEGMSSMVLNHIYNTTTATA